MNLSTIVVTMKYIHTYSQSVNNEIYSKHCMFCTIITKTTYIHTIIVVVLTTCLCIVVPPRVRAACDLAHAMSASVLYVGT